MTAEELKARTRAFAVRVIRLADALPRGLAAQVVDRQLLRLATSVAANYRAAWSSSVASKNPGQAFDRG